MEADGRLTVMSCLHRHNARDSLGWFDAQFRHADNQTPVRQELQAVPLRCFLLEVDF